MCSRPGNWESTNVFYGERQHEHGVRRVAAHALVLESGLDFLAVTHTMLIVASPSFTSPRSFPESDDKGHTSWWPCKEEDGLQQAATFFCSAVRLLLLGPNSGAAAERAARGGASWRMAGALLAPPRQTPRPELLPSLESPISDAAAQKRGNQGN
jgi:hypothetical protein